jgi:neutral ceramidase
VSAAAAPVGGRSPVRRALRALAAGFLPSVAAIHAAGFAASLRGLPFDGLGIAALVLVGVFALVWIVRRAALRRPAWRVVWVLALVAHVVFWSARGLSRSVLRPPGPIEASPVVAWEGPPQPFSAGTGDASFRLTAQDPIAGYGAFPRRAHLPWAAPGILGRWSLDRMGRPGDGGAPRVPVMSRGVPAADDLGARALVLRPREGTGATLAIVRLDLVMTDPLVRAAVLDGVRDLGVTDATLVVCATHTHSGPGGHACAPLAQAVSLDHRRPEAVARIAGAAIDAVRRAHRYAVPARIAFVRAKDAGPDGRPALAENRAGPDPDRIDAEVLGLRLDAADGSRRIALLLNYGVHPTWARARELEFRRDLAGALEDAPALADGATTLFVNGAVGDVKPRVRAPWRDNPTALDPFLAAVAGDLGTRAIDDRLRVVAATVRRDFGSAHAAQRFVGSRGTLLDAARAPAGEGPFDALAAGALLPFNALLWSLACEDLRLVATPRGAFGAVVALDPWLPGTTFSAGAVRLETRSGAAALVWVPGEPTTAVGERIKALGLRRGAAPTYVLGLANDYLGYVATSSECDAGTFEGRATLFGRATADLLVEAAEAALDGAEFRAPR